MSIKHLRMLRSHCLSLSRSVRDRGGKHSSSVYLVNKTNTTISYKNVITLRFPTYGFYIIDMLVFLKNLKQALDKNTSLVLSPIYYRLFFLKLYTEWLFRKDHKSYIFFKSYMLELFQGWKMCCMCVPFSFCKYGRHYWSIKVLCFLE